VRKWLCKNNFCNHGKASLLVCCLHCHECGITERDADPIWPSCPYYNSLFRHVGLEKTGKYKISDYRCDHQFPLFYVRHIGGHNILSHHKCIMTWICEHGFKHNHEYCLKNRLNDSKN